ncbi:MAG: hypothetical protein A4E73_02824 [Syntrophaceae bacterium PtaU1.Bin231]|nr:MAG: hypothetical protein A4E73_02824 [Syntrophaceae bacterium PtaU1.Bin231]
MAGHSRVKFNPVSREIEVEGSEAFVKIYFNKLQALLAGEEVKPGERKSRKVRGAAAPKKVKAAKVPARKTAAKKAAGKAAKKAGKRPDSALSRIVAALKAAADGLTTGQLQEKTGLKQRQIWTTIYRGQKLGKIAKAKRGTYVAV